MTSGKGEDVQVAEDTDEVRWVEKALEEFYGKVPFRPHHDPLSELIFTILSQNTNRGNYERCFNALRSRFLSWEDALAAGPAAIEESIRSGGLSRVKADRISRILLRLKTERSSLNLDFLRELDIESAMGYLMSFPGVKEKTAACVLLFSFGWKVMPVDTHISRISKRFGLVDQRATTASVFRFFLRRSSSIGDAYSFHLNLVRLGREICRARGPIHSCCPLRSRCKNAS